MDRVCAVRNWLVVVALALGLVVELVWPQVPSVRVDPLDPEHVILDAMGGNPGLTTLAGAPASELFREAHDEERAGGHLNALIDAATHSRTYASSIFGYALGLDGHQTGRLTHAEAFESAGASRQDKRDRHADSEPSKIPR